MRVFVLWWERRRYFFGGKPLKHPKILLVGSSPVLSIPDSIWHRATWLQTKTVREALQLFEEHFDLFLVVVEPADVDEKSLSVCVQKLRQNGFCGSIIAVSDTSSDVRKMPTFAIARKFDFLCDSQNLWRQIQLLL